MTLKNHPAKTIWLTGLSGSGKTTLSKELQDLFILHNIQLIRLDGDELRSGLNNDLGFSEEDRSENIRRVAHLSKILNKQGYWTIVALITPLNNQRKLARTIVGENFISVYLNCPLEICEQRDVKGLYKEARKGLSGLLDVAMWQCMRCHTAPTAPSIPARHPSSPKAPHIAVA